MEMVQADIAQASEGPAGRMAKFLRKGIDFEAQRSTDLEKRAKLGWRVAAGLGALLTIAVIALATLAPLRRTIPYLVKVDSQTGNVEVLQTFDNRLIGNQELMNKFWSLAYVTAREQYNWYLVGSDYDLVNRLTNPQILPEYNNQFAGEKAMDKVFGELTERRIKILSVVPAPTAVNQMVVRFERTTIQKNAMVEQPTQFVVNLTYRYAPKVYGAEADLIRNPMGFEVVAYRRDFEVPTSPNASDGAASAAANTTGVSR
jgi:type IV secretion system protein VirB8